MGWMDTPGTGNGVLTTENLANLSSLPVITTAVTEVLELTNSEASSAREVAAALETDPVLTFRVLRIANSGYFSPAARVTRVQDAVTLLGMNLTRSVVVGAAVMESLAPRQAVPGFSVEDYWRHSACVAGVAGCIARSALSRGAEDAFAAGLLHDIGCLVLACNVPEAYADTIRQGRVGCRPLAAIERRVLGTDHGEIGALVAKHWNLPEPLVVAIRHHHEPDRAGEFGPLVAAVHVADGVAHASGARGCETSPSPRVSAEAWSLLGGLSRGMGPEEVHRYVAYLKDQADNVERLSRSFMAA